MNSRRALCLVLLIFVSIVSLSPAAVGTGPFSTVYGPQTTFRAYRASLQLIQAVRAIVVVAMLSLLAQTDSADFAAPNKPQLFFADPPAFVSPLRR